MTQSVFPTREYAGKQYTIREIRLEENIYHIAPESLWKQIQLENNEEGWLLYETLFFYVPDEVITAKYVDLKKYVQENL